MHSCDLGCSVVSINSCTGYCEVQPTTAACPQAPLSLRAPALRAWNANGRVRRGGRRHHLFPRNALRRPLIQIAGQAHAVRACCRPVHGILRKLRRRQGDSHIFKLMIRSGTNNHQHPSVNVQHIVVIVVQHVKLGVAFLQLRRIRFNIFHMPEAARDDHLIDISRRQQRIAIVAECILYSPGHIFFGPNLH